MVHMKRRDFREIREFPSRTGFRAARGIIFAQECVYNEWGSV
jgi:hypothetical protein